MKAKLARITAFSRRVFLELIRDPLSYVFALGFPVVMLLIMTAVNASIPEEAHMTLFAMPSLAPGVYVFGLTFIMLFSALLLAKDRSEAFLVRLYVSPMTDGEFVLSYTAPALVLSLAQGILVYAAAGVISLVTGEGANPAGMLLSLLVSLPSALLYICLGLIFGSVFSDKSAPAASSVIISVSSLLGGIWMDVDAMGGVWLDICRALPFYHSVKLARCAYSLDFSGCGGSIAAVAVWLAVLLPLCAAVFHSKRKI